jgi:hypothetical protein
MKTLSLAVVLALTSLLNSTHAQSWDYRGTLNDAGRAANGRYDLRLTLIDEKTKQPFGNPITLYGVEVKDGQFATAVDFAIALTSAPALKLKTEVQQGDSGFMPLGAPVHFDAKGAPASVCWDTEGNIGTIPNFNFIGTRDDQPLILKSNNVEAARATSTGLQLNGPGFFSDLVELSVRGHIGSNGDFANILLEPRQNPAPTQREGILFSAGGGPVNTNSTEFFLDQLNAAGAQNRRMSFTGNGSVLFADRSTVASFNSTAPNQFMVRAAGGVGLNAAPPADVELAITASGGVNNFANLFMRSQTLNPSGAGVLFSVGNHTNAGNSNDAELYIDQFNTAAAQTRRLVITRTGGVGLNRGDAIYDALGNTAALVVGTSSINGNRAYLSNGGTWTNTSSRLVKEGFQSVDALGILHKVLNLPISTWRYTGSNEGEHLGPMAEDFFDAFGLGNSSASIATVDTAGVAFAAIQGLHAQTQAQDQNQLQALAALQAQNQELQQRLQRLEAQMSAQNAAELSAELQP